MKAHIRMHCFRCLLGVHTQAPKRPNPTNAQKPSNSATLSSNRCAKSCNLSYQIHKFDSQKHIDYETNVQKRIVYLFVKIVHQNEELLLEPLTNRLPSCSANRWPKKIQSIVYKKNGQETRIQIPRRTNCLDNAACDRCGTAQVCPGCN